MTRYIKTTLTAAATIVALTATSAIAQTYPSDFAGLDADKNGQVTFAEYSKVVKTSGMTTTAAAQQFTRISPGDAIITEEELSLALAFQDQPYALQNINNDANISLVSTAPAFEPPVSEVQEAPVADAEPIIIEEAPAETVLETPAPEVEIIREPVPEVTEPTEAVTEPDVTLDTMEPEITEVEAPETEMTEPEETGDILLEEELEPEPEG